MLRNVYLEGELAEKFGAHFEIEATQPREVFQCLDMNFPEFKQYLIDSHENAVGFHIEIGGQEVGEPEELLLTIGEGDMIVTPIPAGSKSGGGKILAAIALAVVTYYTFGAGGWLATGWGSGGIVSASTAGTIAQMGYALAINLALTGIQQLMSPDPSVDSDADESYLFSGGSQNIVEGDPVPVLYGRLKVPGTPISFEVLNRKYTGAGNTSYSNTDFMDSFGTAYYGTAINDF